MRTRTAVLLMVLICSHSVHSQNPAFDTNDPANANAQNNIFYFDSNSDCNSAIRELYGFEATIRGADISSTRLAPTTCTIRLKSTSQYDGTVLDIEVKAMNILDCTTQVAIYDGDGAQLLLMSYDCRSSQNQNKRRFLTSGDTATFIMTRQNVNSVNFDIEIKILPVRGGQDPGYENDWGTNFYFDKFSQEAIVGMIGGFYALVLVICGIFIFMSFRSFRGLDKQWETHQLATIKTGTTFEATSQPSQVWSMGNTQSRGPNSQYSRSVAGPQPYKPKPPPSEDGDSGVFYNDDAFQKRRLMNEERDRARPRYVSNNASFTEPEEDSDHFVEKVITPRVKTANNRNRRPPSYEEAISDHPSDRSSEEESEVSSSDNSVRKRPLSSQGSRSTRSRSSRSRTPSETESEEETGSDDDRSSRSGGARARRRKPKPHKSKRRDSRDHAGPSRSNRPQQQPPPPQQQQMQPVPYGAYPPGQFVPVMAPQFQPVQMVPGYPPPQYPQEQQAAPPPRGPQVQPTEPPVYSYLVRRGYTPLDGRSNSPASTADSQRSGGGRLEEPELRLDSGVEYMRR